MNAKDSPKRTNAGLTLVAAAVVCEVLSVASSQFNFELCHRGIPLVLPVLAIPAAGTLCAIASFFFAPKSVWPTTTKVVVALANVLYLASGVMNVAGPGLVSCG